MSRGKIVGYSLRVYLCLSVEVFSLASIGFTVYTAAEHQLQRSHNPATRPGTMVSEKKVLELQTDIREGSLRAFYHNHNAWSKEEGNKMHPMHRRMNMILLNVLGTPKKEV